MNFSLQLRMFWRLSSITVTDFALPLLSEFLASEEGFSAFWPTVNKFRIALGGQYFSCKRCIWPHTKRISIWWLMFPIFSGPSCIFLMRYRCHEFLFTPLNDPNNNSSNERIARHQEKCLRFLIFVPYTRTIFMHEMIFERWLLLGYFSKKIMVYPVT